jgi:predicted DNA-binding ribbon-helix-helix protein
MKSTVIKRSIVINSRKTSVSLEDEFWKGLQKIAEDRNETVSQLIFSIDKDRQFANLSSAIRLFVLHHYRDQIKNYQSTRSHPKVNHSIIQRPRPNSLEVPDLT